MDADLTRALNTPIKLLPLSESFKQLTFQQGCHTLNEITSMPLTKLVTQKWVTDKMLAELGEFIYNTRHNTTSKE
ncbi:MAG: hypothetical protein ABI581_12355 [Sediminibacterium sp.]